MHDDHADLRATLEVLARAHDGVQLEHAIDRWYERAASEAARWM